MTRLLPLMLYLGVSACSSVPADRGTQDPSGSRFKVEIAATVARSRVFDFVSKVNGLPYRVMVATPPSWEPAKPLPVLYLLDGNENFGTAADILTRHSRLRVSAPGIIVAIGYPTDDPAEFIRRREFDLTPSPSKDPKESGLYGGADPFIRVLEEEVKPLVASHFRIDSARQAIWGHSLGGLTALRILFRWPDAYSTYVIASPSIWWGDREILAEETAFAGRIKKGRHRLRVLITSAANEQYRGTDPARLAAEGHRMVDDASELASRLGQLDPKKLEVARTVFEGEVHASVQPATLSRAVRFAFPRE